MDLLLDIDSIVDVCAGREPFAARVREAMDACRLGGARVWVYVGSVQGMESALVHELRRQRVAAGTEYEDQQLVLRARERLKSFCSETHWLAALAGEGDVFAAPDPAAEQLLRALERFPEEGARLLTRDEGLLAAHPGRTISPERYCARPVAAPSPEFIDLKAQQDRIRSELERSTHRVLHHGRYILGPEVGELEERLAEYVGVRHCIGVASGTDALLIALMALEIGPGDEVITTPFSFIATAEAIALLGATSVFVDIDPRTYNIDPSNIESAITPRTRAIMPVSLYGQPADFDEINTIASRHGLPVIEDGAQSFGATYKGRKSCGLTTIGATSFFPSKPLGCYGDGGALFTNDDGLAKIMREIRVHGQDRRYHHPHVGVNGRLDTLQAAFLLPKLEIFPREVELRQAVARRYGEMICAQVDVEVATPWIAPDRTSVYAQYTVQVPDRDAALAAFKAANIPAVVHYPVSIDCQPAFASLDRAPRNIPNTVTAVQRVLSIPMHPYLELGYQRTIVALLCQVVRK